MDYLQNLEFQAAALQRKLRLLQDFRSFVDMASSEELASFGEELKSVTSASGQALGSILASVLGAPGASGLLPSGPPRAAAPVMAAAPSRTAALATDPAVGLAAASAGAAAARSAPAAPPAEASAPGEGALAEALGLIEASMKPIPAGSFLMGSELADAEKPPHKVSLSAYRIGDHLVTNKEYSLFVAANLHWAKDRADPELRDEFYLSDWGEAGFPEGKEDYPVAFVSFHAASAFAAWLGKRLPTEAEWECAARGGLVGKKYPLGDLMNDKLANLAKQYRGTTPAGKFDPNGYGLYDMAGNLFEWCSDWYGPYAPGEARDPAGPAEGDYKVARGGSWMSGAGALRVSARVDMEIQSCGQVGIRLVDRGL
jgi:formylglycine-generating enzyme required for sulfatase activity